MDMNTQKLKHCVQGCVFHKDNLHVISIQLYFITSNTDYWIIFEIWTLIITYFLNVWYFHGCSGVAQSV
jgi:hypothetical protein